MLESRNLLGFLNSQRNNTRVNEEAFRILQKQFLFLNVFVNFII